MRSCMVKKVANMIQNKYDPFNPLVLENSSTCTFANSEHSHEGSLTDQKDKHRPKDNRGFETDEFESICLQDNQPWPSYANLSD